MHWNYWKQHKSEKIKKSSENADEQLFVNKIIQTPLIGKFPSEIKLNTTNNSSSKKKCKKSQDYVMKWNCTPEDVRNLEWGSLLVEIKKVRKNVFNRCVIEFF